MAEPVPAPGEEGAAECAGRGWWGGGLRWSAEPVLLLCTLALGLEEPLCTQYLWHRLGEGGGAQNGTPPAAEAGAGCTNQSQGSGGAQEQELEALVARWNLYLNLSGFLVGLFAVTLLGPWSDSVGRRSALTLPALGMTLEAGIFLVVMYGQWPVGYLLVGRIVAGLSGDYNLVLAASFAYAADITTAPTRTFRVAVLEACLGLAGMAASLAGGPWLRAQGYVAPFWMVFGTSLAATAYAAFILHESVAQPQPAKLLTTRHYRAVARLYVGPARKKLVLFTLAFFFVVTVHFGTRGLLVLFELGSPLCWGPEMVGLGSAASYLTFLSSLAALRLLQKWMPEAWVAELGLLSNVSGLVVLSMAMTTTLMFTGYGLLFLSMTVTPILRAKLSRLVDETEQGALFSAVACVEGLCSLGATGVFTALYPATLPFMKGFPFLFGAILLLLPAAIIGWIQIQDSKPEYRHFTDVAEPSPGPTDSGSTVAENGSETSSTR
uniref:Proton-coupled folate transporter n=1 Tax=Anolis carolinensis TaxID=28377 RepID=H9GIG8_ANOCA|nr:PREDICTED: proton-coupled folate transporter [Anolis carolinensis]|eukprot:XP_003227310.1 PREDICTED: proton-coupled folate transporter [Anolis carolinensis]